MTNPTDTHAKQALEQVMPRFPRRWHKQLMRLGLDSFSNFLSKNNTELVYTIKSGSTVMMARCLWNVCPNAEGVDPTELVCSLEVINTRGTATASLS